MIFSAKMTPLGLLAVLLLAMAVCLAAPASDEERDLENLGLKKRDTDEQLEKRIFLSNIPTIWARDGHDGDVMTRRGWLSDIVRQGEDAIRQHYGVPG